MKAFYCAGTHWDREWYEPFQEFRMWLVELIDDLLDLMEREPEYKCFHLDGQAVVLQDYLAIRPENRERLLKLLREKRIVAGPWYVLPDEWLISGESYIRNIMMGMGVCRELGFDAMNFAYTPDQFGHIAALPMLMTGLGLQAGICWRGAQDENFPAHFMWGGPDGSRMPTFKLRDDGSYAPFLFRVRNQVKEAELSDESFEKHFDPYLKEEMARTEAPLVLMLDAIDHYPADPELVPILAKLRERHPEVEFVWGTLEEYGAEMVKRAGQFPERSGELREPCRTSGRGGQYLIVHTISSRYPIKKRNDECQALLEKWAEPQALFQSMAGGKPIVSYLALAWEYLLKNHPHDSICGCSVDQVHRDMMYRFDQCEGLCDGVVRRALAANAKASAKEEALTKVVVHNPLPHRRQGVVEVVVPFNPKWEPNYIDGLATSERVNKFVLKKKDGARVPFQLSRIEHETSHKRIADNGRPANFHGNFYHLAAELDIPACGSTGFTIEPTEEGVRNFGSLMNGPLSASTGEVTFALNADGTGTLVHEATGRKYEGLFVYEDRGDCGDGWTWGEMINDVIVRSPGTRVTTAVDEDGPLRTVFRVEREFDLPRMMDRKTQWRSEDRRTVRVVDLIYVEKGAQGVRVTSRVENACMDHRMRVLFPSGTDAAESFAETPFAVVNRTIDVPEECGAWHERVNPEKAFTTFFGVQDEEGGLAVLAPKGLHEYEVTQTPERSLALTLFRSTYQTVATAGEPDGQLLEAMGFEYELAPFSGAFDCVAGCRRVAELQTGIRMHQTEDLGEDQSFLHLERGEVVVTALKVAADGDGGVIRLWNPTEVVRDECIHVNCDVVSVARCDLNETPIEPIALEADKGIPVSVPAGGLVTVRFTWA